MDVLGGIQQGIEETEALAREFDVGDKRIDALAKGTMLFGFAGHGGWVVANLERTITAIATSHAQECDRERCRTCLWIGEALASAVVSLRQRLAVELGQEVESATTDLSSFSSPSPSSRLAPHGCQSPRPPQRIAAEQRRRVPSRPPRRRG